MTCNLLQSYLELAVATTRTVTWICYVCIHTYICTYVEATSRSRDNNDELRRPGQYVEVRKHRVIYVRNILIIKLSQLCEGKQLDSLEAGPASLSFQDDLHMDAALVHNSKLATRRFHYYKSSVLNVCNIFFFKQAE